MEHLPKTITDKLDEGRQYRRVMEIRADDEDDGKIVRGYATTFDQPYTLWTEPGYIVQEQVDSRAFDGCDMDDVIMQYDHAGRVFARITNGTLTVQPDERGLAIAADLGGTEIGRQLYEEIAGGYTDKMSFGFRVGKDRKELVSTDADGTKTILRTIENITKLFDVSAVSLPANDATSISARNQGEGVIAEIKQELLAAEQRERQKQKIKILTKVSE